MNALQSLKQVKREVNFYQNKMVGTVVNLKNYLDEVEACETYLK